MTSSAAEDKKRHEREILRDALIAARKRGGECRRLCDRINGVIVDRDYDERPDIVLRHENRDGTGYLIGVEHFRVDQLLEWSSKVGKPMSAMMRVNGRLNHLRTSVRKNESRGLTDYQREELGCILDEVIIAQGAESYDSFIQAFSDTFNSHLTKSTVYRENISRVSDGSDAIKLALLIETHVDYSHLRCWDGYKMSIPCDGELPLSKELVELFCGAAGRVDYLILAMCPRFTSEVVDARVINGSSVKLSLKRQKAKTLEYLGDYRSCAGFVEREAAGASRIKDLEIGEYTVHYKPVEEGDGVSDLEVFLRDMDGFAQALELREKHKPFIASFGVSMFLETYGDYAVRELVPGIRFELSDLMRWKKQMGSTEWERRIDSFRKTHGISDELLSGYDMSH